MNGQPIDSTEWNTIATYTIGDEENRHSKLVLIGCQVELILHTVETSITDTNYRIVSHGAPDYHPNKNIPRSIKFMR